MTNFPTALDALTNPSGTDALDAVAVPHATQHANANDAIEALQAKVGVDGSEVAGSLDYKIAALEAASGLKATYSVFGGYISGLWMEWNSGSSISITSGACYIPSLGRVSVVPATLTLSSLSLSANTWYHIYLYESAGTPDIEIVTTAPAAAYSGTARAKTGDTSRRYLGSVKTDSGGNLISIQQAGSLVLYRNDVIANLIIAGGGTSTASAAVDSSAYVPVTSYLAMILHYNSATNAFVFVSNSNSVAVPAAYLSAIAPSTYLDSDTLLNGSQQFTYAYNTAPTGGGAYYPRVKGYTYYR